MSTNRRWLLIGCWMSAPAWAAPEVAMGVGIGVQGDLPDAASDGNTRLRAGAALDVPLRVRLLDPLRLRVDLGLVEATGVDELTWSASTEGVEVRRTDADAHLAVLAGARLTAGLEVQVPLSGRARPYFYADVGVIGVGMFHALREEAAVLLDPSQNRVGQSSNVDPYTTQAGLHLGAGAGLVVRATDRLDVIAEFGYASTFVGARTLRKTAPDQDARREAFAFNPLQAMVGLTWRL